MLEEKKWLKVYGNWETETKIMEVVMRGSQNIFVFHKSSKIRGAWQIVDERFKN